MQSLHSTDLNGDGDADLLWADGQNGRIVWAAGRGDGTFAGPTSIDTQIARVGEALPADLDGDGDLDVVGLSSGAGFVAWYENQGGGVFGPRTPIDTSAGLPIRVRAGDLDGDGDLDLVVVDWNRRIVAYANLGGGTFGSGDVLATSISYLSRVELGDLDGDGDLEVVYGGQFDFGWIENLGGSFAPPVALPMPGTDLWRLELRDVDVDSDLDICFIPNFYQTLYLIENLGGGSFANWIPLADQVDYEGQWLFVDVDRDGVRDLISTAEWDVFVWRRGLGGLAFGEPRPVQYSYPLEFLEAVDLDGDAVPDLVGWTEFDSSLWTFRNFGAGLFESTYSRPLPGSQARDVALGDLDLDGDLDVATSESSGGLLRWFANDGTGQFGTETVIDSTPVDVDGTKLVDVDGDGDLDFVTAAVTPRLTVLYENTGAGAFGPPQAIDAAYDTLRIDAADLDADGDADLVATTWADDVVLYFENLGAGVFGAARVIAAQSARADFELADLDADGDFDLVLARVFGTELAWVENLGSGQFGPLTTIDSTLSNPAFVTAGDIDGDSIVDLVTTSQAGDDGIVWLRGLGGASFDAPEYLARDNFEPSTGELIDDDGDGDLDLVVSRLGDYGLCRFENRGGELVLDEILDWNDRTSRAWSTGDLDGDGSIDLVTADPITDSLRTYLNTAEEWTNFCSSTPNSLGFAAVLSASGSTRVSNANFVVRAAPVPDQPGIFFHGANPASRTFGTGFLCASGGVARGSVVVASGQQASYSYDNSGPLRTLAPFVGGMRYFQYWYRDPLGASGFDTTDGLRIYVLP